MSSHLHIDSFRYDAMIGVGGIGSGSFFAICGNETLGREESRGGRFLDQQDHCKLHIIAHYVQTLLGPRFVTLPIGMVGDDEVGRRMRAEMVEAGMDTRYVAQKAGEQTLFSFCFLYPDGTGGNLTTDDSASSHVDSRLVCGAEGEFQRFAGRGIALAAPEVPLDARAALLRLGTEHRFFRAASFTAQEMSVVIKRGLLRDLDLVGLNSAEAAAGLGLPETALVEDIVSAWAGLFCVENPQVRVSITAGVRGSWMIFGGQIVHQPAFAAKGCNTAGAGDAHLAGLIVGAVAGLSNGDARTLAALVASLSVESRHTINKGAGRASLIEFAQRQSGAISGAVLALLC
jgi:ribokinase